MMHIVKCEILLNYIKDYDFLNIGTSYPIYLSL